MPDLEVGGHLLLVGGQLPMLMVGSQLILLLFPMGLLVSFRTTSSDNLRSMVALGNQVPKVAFRTPVCVTRLSRVKRISIRLRRFMQGSSGPSRQGIHSGMFWSWRLMTLIRRPS